MAKKRMFYIDIINSDKFLDMPLSAQALYMHLNLNADDEGFVNSPKRIQRYVGASDDDIKILIAKGYIIPFESGVIVITHWKQHNSIKSDRFTPTLYTEEKDLLFYEKGAYTLEKSTLFPKSFQDVSTDKVSIDKISIDSSSSNACVRDKDYTDVWRDLTNEEIEELEFIYSRADDLIAKVAHEVRTRKRIIEDGKIYAYIVAYAERNNWITNKELTESEVD